MIRSRLFVTVAICTYNRCESLVETLGTLAAQQRASPADWQVLIIDNNCSDATLSVISGFAGRIGMRVVRETRQGLSHARNRALREAHGEWILFIDDDVKLAPDWLAAWIDALRDAPDVGYAGGRILPDWGAAPPRWFHGEKLALIDGALVWFDLGEVVQPLRDGDPQPFGGNMAIRREVALGLNGFRPDLGMRGEEVGRGEETDLFLRIRRKGTGGLYVGTAQCRHRYEPARFTPRALFRYGVASGLAHRAIVDAKAAGSWTASGAYLARGAVQLLKGRGDRFRQCVVNAGIQAALAAPVLHEDN
jgi:glycosyltransferase involved in cell wall biosynthesis